MFKSEMCKLYNDIYGEQMLNKVFNSRLSNICNMINDDGIVKKLKENELGYYSDYIKPVIDKQKNIKYESAIFFIPLIKRYDYKIITKSKNVTTNEFYEWITGVEKAQIPVRKELIKSVNNTILRDKINKINRNKKLSPAEKTEKVSIEKRKFFHCMNMVFENNETNFLISGGIYIKIRDFIIKKYEDEHIAKELQYIRDVIENSTPTIRINIIPKIEKLIKREIEKYEKGKIKLNYEDINAIKSIRLASDMAKYDEEKQAYIESLGEKYSLFKREMMAEEYIIKKYENEK